MLVRTPFHNRAHTFAISNLDTPLNLWKEACVMQGELNYVTIKDFSRLQKSPSSHNWSQGRTAVVVCFTLYGQVLGRLAITSL